MRTLIISLGISLPFLLALPPLALADSYLVQSTLAAARAVSAKQCQAVGCDGQQTVYWPPVVGGAGHAAGFVPPSALNAAVRVPTSGPYGTQGMTAAQIAALQTAAQLQTSGWTIPASANSSSVSGSSHP